jgi:hypothetical protein
MKRRERKLQLRFDPSGTDDPAPVANPRDVIEQGRLPHPGLPTQNERAALSAAHRAQQLVEPRTLGGAAAKHLPRGSREPFRWGGFRLGLATDLDVAHCGLRGCIVQ